MYLLWLLALFLFSLSSDFQEVQGYCADRELDIAILADISRSLTHNDLVLFKKVVIDMINGVDVSHDGIHFGLITFGDQAKRHNYFKQPHYHNKENLRKLVLDKIKRALIVGTRTDIALRLARDELFVPENGDRKDADNLLFLFTDGKPFKHNPNVNFEQLSKSLENKGVKIIAVGIGNNINGAFLTKVAGKNGNVIRVKNFNALTAKIGELLERGCAIDGGYSGWRATSECTKKFTRTCTNPSPSKYGKDCSGLGPATKDVPCNEQECSIDGGYTDWSEASECSVTCGGGTQAFIRSCTSPPPSNGGKDCSGLGPATKDVSCNEQECPPPCTAGLDVAIVLDKSKSVGTKNLKMVITFLVELISKFHPAPDADHFGFITFHKNANLVFDFANSEYHEKDALLEKIASEPIKLELQTRTDLALTMARDKLFTKEGGDREGKPNVMIILTDGKPTKPKKQKKFSFTDFAEGISKEFKEKHVNTVAVGIGPNIDTGTLELIAGDGHVVKVDKFNKLEEMMATIKSSACSD